MRTLPLICTVLLMSHAAIVSAAEPECRLQAAERRALVELKGKAWEVSDVSRRDQLADMLVGCLGSPDPLLRDELALDAIQTWFERGDLRKEHARSIGNRLIDRMARPDPVGVAQSFAALALASVVQADGRTRLWSDAERQTVFRTSLDWFKAVRDYRGYSPDIGWRHAVAHGADLMLEFARNPGMGKAQLTAILDAIAVQAAPAGHSYIHGESERLARAVVYVAMRNEHSEAEWTSWLTRLAGAVPLHPGEPLSLESLDRVHDVRTLLLAVYVFASESGDDLVRRRMLPGVVAALRAAH